ncbi:MAG: SDR family oxidoreductase [Phaeodactylibacter sp.]|nr:SDR family oxidoreductase [Phaeodactylibacter sp.]
MDNPFHLRNKTAVITGGSSGIGAAIAQLFAEAGAQVFIFDVNPKKAAQPGGRPGQEAGFLAVDVSRQEEVIQAMSEVTGQTGRLDILVNNAGIAQVGALEDTTEADIDRLFAVNVKGVYNCMYAAVKYMKNQRSGVILNMASVASELGLPQRFAYSMSKAAVLNMSYTVARDYLEYNIRCNSISPARIHTPFVDGFLAKNYPGREAQMFEQLSKTQPVGRMGKPEEVACLALYLCSDAAAFITGANFPIDGGFIKLNT